MSANLTITADQPKLRGNEFESSHPKGLDVGPDTDVIAKIEVFNVVRQGFPNIRRIDPSSCAFGF
jgi:hypothetical protein